MADESIQFTPDNESTPDVASPNVSDISFTPDDQQAALQDKYGGAKQQAIAGLEAFGKGLAGPLATQFEKSIGVKPEDMLGREQANPITHVAGEVAGLALPSAIPGVGEFTQAGLLGKAGEAAAGALGAKGAVATAARLGVENALFSIGDEVSKEITNNPDSIQTAAIHVGLNGLLGAGVGYGLGKVGDLWKAKFGPDSEGIVKDFKDRLAAHSNGTLPTAENVAEELSNEHQAVKGISDDLRGSGGLKAQDLQKVLPEIISPQMIEQGNKILQSADELVSKAKAEPGIYQGGRTSAVSDYGLRLANSLADPELTPSKMFTAIDDFKKGIGSLKNFNAFSPEVEKPSASLIGKLYNNVREGLESPEVWGKAGERQKAINEAFSSYIPAAKDFERTFTEKLGGEANVSPGKVSTFVNGLGKPNAEIKVEKLRNYLQANDNLYSELDKIHSNLEIENPYQRPSLINTRQVANDITPGMKAADMVTSHAINAASEGLGSGTGALLGHLSQIPGGAYLGAAFGHHVAKPFLRTIMPSLINPILKSPASGEGLKAALDGIEAVSRGNSLMTSTAKAIFQSGSKSIINSLVPDDKSLDKLDKKLSDLQHDPNRLMDVGGQLADYMPNHNSALAATAQNASTYLNGLKPGVNKPGVLNAPINPSPAMEKAYKRSLSIAEQPLSILSHVQNGTLQPKDVQDLKTLYPDLYTKLSSKLSNAMIEHLSQGNDVPYKLRRGLSILTGQMLDSNLSPQSIQAAQATYIPLNPPKMAQEASKPKRGTSKLGKSAEMAQTPSQARQKALLKA